MPWVLHRTMFHLNNCFWCAKPHPTFFLSVVAAQGERHVFTDRRTFFFPDVSPQRCLTNKNTHQFVDVNCVLLHLQTGAVDGPGEQACEHGGAHQVGRTHPSRRRARHRLNRADAAAPRLRSGLEPAQLRPTGRAGREAHGGPNARGETRTCRGRRRRRGGWKQ